MERQATERVKKLMKVVRAPKIVFSVEKATLFTKAYREYEGDPNVIRMAKAQAYVLDQISIFILDGDLLAGAPASKLTSGQEEPGRRKGLILCAERNMRFPRKRHRKWWS